MLLLLAGAAPASSGGASDPVSALWVPFFLSFLLAFCLHFFSTFLVLFFVCPWSVSEVGVMGDVPFLFRSNSSVQTWVCGDLMGSLLLLCTRSGSSVFFPVFGGFFAHKNSMDFLWGLGRFLHCRGGGEVV